MFDLGLNCYFEEKMEEAKEWLTESLGMRLRMFGSNHPATAQSMNNLAALAHMQGNLLLAKHYYSESLGML